MRKCCGILRTTLALGFICAVLSDYVGLQAVDNGIFNKNIERTVDITSQVVKVSLKLIISHVDKRNIDKYTFLVPEYERTSLSHLSARDASKKEIRMIEDERRSWGNHTGFTMKFQKGVQQIIYIEAVYTKILFPYPSFVKQSESQLVKYQGNVYFFSPYRTESQITTVKIGTKNIESYTVVKPVSFLENKIMYGPYHNTGTFNHQDLVVHFENNAPFLTVTRIERTIEVSHWGNVAVEETIDILHSGAKLKPSFSRYEFQKDPRGAQSSVKSFKTMLPASATDVYYRDTNGNISTSNMKILKDSVELDLRPRFPLFGGWRTHYTLGYNIPSYEYVFRRENEFLLKMRVVDHIFDDMIIDEVIVKIILPEYSTDLKLFTPFPVTRLADASHFTYLDLTGRPVISFTKKNLVENHIHDFNVKYNFTSMAMLLEPGLIITFLLIVFISVLFITRFDFSINNRCDIHFHKE